MHNPFAPNEEYPILYLEIEKIIGLFQHPDSKLTTLITDSQEIEAVVIFINPSSRI